MEKEIICSDRVETRVRFAVSLHSLRAMLFLLIIFSGQVFCLAEDEGDPDQAMADGLAAFDNGQFRESIRHWQKAGLPPTK